MKNICILIFLALSAIASGTSYYISPSGNDSNSGTISSPFFTLNKAWSVIKAGDIIYVRGGVYRFTSRQTLSGKNGTATDTIKIFAYPGEHPIFTRSSTFTTPGWPVSLIYLVGNYTYWKGIEITKFTQLNKEIWYGMAVRQSNNNRFERLNSHHNGHGMVIRDESGNNLVVNSDFHNNYDPLTEGDAYGNADGLSVGYCAITKENTVRNCRFWNNSDDGIDLWQHNGNFILEGCWAWNNGYREDGRTTAGDGGGFKFGATTTTTGTEFKRTVRNNMSVYNRTKGYNQNAANCKFYFYNNIAYKNPNGAVFYSYNLANIFRNNIVFDNSGGNWTGTYTNSVRDHNSYDPVMSPSGPGASSADFVSIDTTGISGARQSNGALPNINFMKLKAGSDLIDAGANVGLPYKGTAPDLGPFEYSATTSSTSGTTLTYVSSLVKNTLTNEVEVTYNSTIATIVPSTTCYEIKVNSVARTVTNLIISGKTVRVQLSSPVNYGDVVTLSYTKPDINPLQCTAGTIATSITGKTVTNSVIAAVPPAYVGSDVDNASPDKIKMKYDVKLASIVPAASSFTPKVNGSVKTVKSVAITDNIVTLTLSSALTNTDTVTVAYTKPATNPLQNTSGAVAENIIDKSVSNNILGVATGTEKINNGKITIFPNPASDYIRIANFDPGTKDVPVLRIFDFAGKLCAEIKLPDAARMRKIPINLSSGMYIAQVLMGSMVHYVQKVIVVK